MLSMQAAVDVSSTEMKDILSQYTYNQLVKLNDNGLIELYTLSSSGPMCSKQQYRH